MKRNGTTRRSEPRGRRARRTGWRTGAAAILTAVLLVGAGATALYLARGPQTEVASSPPGRRTPSTPAVPVTVGARPGQRAPDFALTTTTGDSFRLSSYRGQVVLLDFLAPG